MSKENIEITTIKITELNPAQYNPRKISNEEYNKLSRSISEFGLVDPIIINLNNRNTIIGGHQRYDVLMDEYIAGNKDYEELILIKNGDIGWVFPNTKLEIKDLNQEKSMNLTLNKLDGEWDLEKLEMLFADLSVEGVDLSMTGWDKNEIKDLSKEIDLTNFGTDELSLEDTLAEEEEERKKGTVKHSRNKKEITCPECGNIFMEEEYFDEDI